MQDKPEFMQNEYARMMAQGVINLNTDLAPLGEQNAQQLQYHPELEEFYNRQQHSHIMQSLVSSHSNPATMSNPYQVP